MIGGAGKMFRSTHVIIFVLLFTACSRTSKLFGALEVHRIVLDECLAAKDCSEDSCPCLSALCTESEASCTRDIKAAVLQRFFLHTWLIIYEPISEKIDGDSGTLRLRRKLELQGRDGLDLPNEVTLCLKKIGKRWLLRRSCADAV